MAKIHSDNKTSKKAVIVKHAATLFKSKSYTASSMRELAEMVGVEAPSLYNHIGSKGELLEEICIKTGNLFTVQIAKINESKATATQKLEVLIRFHITIMAEKFDEVYVANHEWKHLQEPHLSVFLNFRRNYEKSLVLLIEQGISNKELRPVNPYIAVLTILSAVRGLEFWQRNKKNITKQELEDQMVHHLLNGIVL